MNTISYDTFAPAFYTKLQTFGLAHYILPFSLHESRQSCFEVSSFHKVKDILQKIFLQRKKEKEISNPFFFMVVLNFWQINLMRLFNSSGNNEFALCVTFQGVSGQCKQSCGDKCFLPCYCGQRKPISKFQALNSSNFYYCQKNEPYVS